MVATNLVILIAGLAVAAIAGIFIKKAKTRKTGLWIGGIIAVAGILLFVPAVQTATEGWGIPTTIFAAAPTPTPTIGEVGTGPCPVFGFTRVDGICTCLGVEDTTVTLSAQDKYTSEASGGTHRYSLDNGVAKTVSDAGTFTASPGQTLETLYGNETSETYFGIIDSSIIPCAGVYEPPNIRTVRNATITINVYNEGGDLITNALAAASNNESVVAGDTVNLKIEVRGSNKRGFPYGGVLTWEANGTAWDVPMTELELGGLSVSKTNTPAVHELASTTSSAAGATTHKTVSWEIGAFEQATLYTGTITMVADDDVAPTPQATPRLTFRANDYYIDEDAGGAIAGPAIDDENDAINFGQAGTRYIPVTTT